MPMRWSLGPGRLRSRDVSGGTDGPLDRAMRRHQFNHGRSAHPFFRQTVWRQASAPIEAVTGAAPSGPCAAGGERRMSVAEALRQDEHVVARVAPMLEERERLEAR